MQSLAKSLSTTKGRYVDPERTTHGRLRYTVRKSCTKFSINSLMSLKRRFSRRFFMPGSLRNRYCNLSRATLQRKHALHRLWSLRATPSTWFL